MQPSHDYFQNLAAECNNYKVVVDMYVGLDKVQKSIDLTTMAPICGMTGGSLYFYNNFDVTMHGEKIYYELFRSLTRPVVSDVQLKARVSTGFTVSEYIGG